MLKEYGLWSVETAKNGNNKEEAEAQGKRIAQLKNMAYGSLVCRHQAPIMSICLAEAHIPNTLITGAGMNAMQVENPNAPSYKLNTTPEGPGYHSFIVTTDGNAIVEATAVQEGANPYNGIINGVTAKDMIYHGHAAIIDNGLVYGGHLGDGNNLDAERANKSQKYSMARFNEDLKLSVKLTGKINEWERLSHPPLGHSEFSLKTERKYYKTGLKDAINYIQADIDAATSLKSTAIELLTKNGIRDVAGHSIYWEQLCRETHLSTLSSVSIRELEKKVSETGRGLPQYIQGRLQGAKENKIDDAVSALKKLDIGVDLADLGLIHRKQVAVPEKENLQDNKIGRNEMELLHRPVRNSETNTDLQPYSHQRFDALFKALDLNGDRTLTRKEIDEIAKAAKAQGLSFDTDQLMLNMDTAILVQPPVAAITPHNKNTSAK